MQKNHFYLPKRLLFRKIKAIFVGMDKKSYPKHPQVAITEGASKQLDEMVKIRMERIGAHGGKKGKFCMKNGASRRLIACDAIENLYLIEKEKSTHDIGD